mmetsp:Transcript_55398/g.80937  ORF Transcript_55398/g.80937 Transcript_55398/m.80937 type:complete len:177 (+) Transcript_55398:104-634(+)
MYTLYLPSCCRRFKAKPQEEERHLHLTILDDMYGQYLEEYVGISTSNRLEGIMTVNSTRTGRHQKKALQVKGGLRKGTAEGQGGISTKEQSLCEVWCEVCTPSNFQKVVQMNVGRRRRSVVQQERGALSHKKKRRDLFPQEHEAGIKMLWHVSYSNSLQYSKHYEELSTHAMAIGQ